MNHQTDYILTYRGVVYPWQCDHIGHMNVVWYAAKFDEASWNLLASCGITARYLNYLRRGMAAVRQNTIYKKELFAGDVVTFRTKILEVRERTIRFQHEVIHEESNEIAAVSEFTAVHIDQDTRKACAFPPEILERLHCTLNLASDSADGDRSRPRDAAPSRHLSGAAR